MAALENILTIGPPSSPILTLTNAPANGNGDGVSQVGGVFAVDVIGDELSIDTISALVRYGGPLDVGMTVYEVYLGPDNEVYLDPDGESVYSQLLASVPDGSRDTDVNLRLLPYGTPVKWQCDGRTIAAFYLKNVERAGRYLFRLNATSGVGLLDRVDHPGGIYTGQTFAAVAGDIINGMFPVTIADALASQEVYGWLPYDTRRNNLHQLLFVFGAALRRDEDGNAVIAFLTDTQPKDVGDDRLSIGGDVDYETPATRVEATEHAFYSDANDETVTLFDNTDGGAAADDTLVIFSDAPAHDLAVSGTLTIEESGVNYAIVSGVGTLTGQLYTHLMRIVAADVPDASGEPNVKHVTDMTLVSLANSLNVARRVLAYCSSAKTVSASIALEGERCGDVISCNDPFFEAMTAFLQQANVNASSDLWGPCRLIEGYTPQYQGNNVTGSDTITESGTWTSPITGTLTAIIVAPGSGGAGGANGAVGTGAAKSWQNYSGGVLSVSPGVGGAGGAGGAAGSAGKVLVVTISVTEGQQFICTVGAAGTGGAVGEAGTAGGITTFGSYSSEDGEIFPNGYIDPIGGELMAAPGTDGIDGGNGGNGGTAQSSQATSGQNGGDAGAYTGGTGGTGDYRTGGLNNDYKESEPGAGGGGASGNANGENGANGQIIAGTNKTGARGGAGANAIAPAAKTALGCGGDGGNGGGGGGGAGGWYLTQPASYGTFPYVRYYAVGGVAGAGAAGGDGGPGGIKLYWGD